ncbi:MAG: HAD family phosphatase [Bdellovibrionales bacterium]|nr:HAD family phosphatase [Bdellovibrionales bacterium]
MKKVLENVSAVIFDLDGLIISSETVVRDSWHEAADSHGYDMRPMYHRLIGNCHNKSNEVLFEHFGSDFPIDTLRSLVSSIVDRRIEEGELALKPGIVPLLEKLQSSRKKIGLATSSSMNWIERSLVPLGVAHLFEAIVTREHVTHTKPHPECYLTAATILEVPPHQCLVLEDSHQGVQAALNAKMKVCMVPDLIEPEPWVYEKGIPVLPSLEVLL